MDVSELVMCSFSLIAQGFRSNCGEGGTCVQVVVQSKNVLRKTVVWETVPNTAIPEAIPVLFS